MHPELDKFLKELPVRQPLTFKAVYPKRIIPPNGYLNPKYFAFTLWSEYMVGFESELNMLPHVTGLANCLMHLEYRVPTYFVRSEFAQAVAQTEPPEDFKFSEIQWPLPAMLFVLPTDFVLNYFGFMCPFISVTRLSAGIYPNKLKNLPPCELPVKGVNGFDNKVDRITIVYPVYSATVAVPVDYTGSYPLTMNVNKMANAPFQDATYMEEARARERLTDFVLPRHDKGLPAEGEEEKTFNAKVQAFAVKIMLVLNAAHNVTKIGGVARPEKTKKGRRVDELWHPNLIGWDYRARRIDPAQGAHGTHASPRMHWRRGHMRNQPYGHKPWSEDSPKRITWIEPVLINAPTDEVQ